MPTRPRSSSTVSSSTSIRGAPLPLLRFPLPRHRRRLLLPRRFSGFRRICRLCMPCLRFDLLKMLSVVLLRVRRRGVLRICWSLRGRRRLVAVGITRMGLHPPKLTFRPKSMF